MTDKYKVTGGFDGGVNSVWNSGIEQAAGGVEGEDPAPAEWTASDGLKIELIAMDQTPDGVLDAPYRFQCPPLEEIVTNFGFQHSDYDTVFRGQFSRRMGRQLRTIDFSTLAVFYPADFAVTIGDYDLLSHRERLREISESGAVFWFQMFEVWPEIELGMPATLRSLQSSQKAGEVDARYFDVSFSEWRDPVVIGQALSNWPKQATIHPDTTLVQLATNFYHHAGYWPRIGDANEGLKNWGGNTPIVKSKKWEAGDKLKIPAPPG